MAASVRFRPSLAVTLFVLPALAILIALGVWQLERKVWKETLIATIHEREAAAPIPFIDALQLAAALPEDQRASIEFRRVHVTGAVVDAKPVQFAVMDPDNVRRSLIAIKPEIGIVFLDVRTPEGYAPLGGAKSFDGIGVMRFGKIPNSFTPANDPAHEQWFWPDVTAAAAARGLQRPANFYLAVEEKGGPPNSAAVPVLPNNHLSYALTWFGLAIGLLAVYLLWHYKNGRLGFGREN